MQGERRFMPKFKNNIIILEYQVAVKRNKVFRKYDLSDIEKENIKIISECIDSFNRHIEVVLVLDAREDNYMKVYGERGPFRNK